jgi:hypothetical protein
VRTCLSREFAFLRREAAVSAGVRAGASGAVGRDAQDTATSGLRAAISLSGYLPVPHRRWVILSSDRAQAKPRSRTPAFRAGVHGWLGDKVGRDAPAVSILRQPAVGENARRSNEVVPSPGLTWVGL